MNWRPGLRPAGWMTAALLLSSSLLALGLLQRWMIREFVAVFAVQVLVYGLAAWLLLKGRLHAQRRERQALIAVLVVAALLRGIALFAPSALSTDAYRYVWDGRVQAAGVNPYRYIPADPALAGLRDGAIYPNINRAEYAHTIYPPTAQAVFLAASRISDSFTGMKLAMIAFDALSIGCLIALLRRRGQPATRVLLYAWHPLPLWEFAGSGHVDAVAIGLLLLAFLFAERRAPAWTGAALAAATLVKYYPLVAAPALYRRWNGRLDWRMPAAFVATAGLLYLPYLGVGKAVFGFLPGYADEENLRDGTGFFLWAMLKSGFEVPADGLSYYLPFAAIALLALAAWMQFSGRAAALGRVGVGGAMLLASAFTLLVSPHQPWYFVWLVPFLCFRFSIAHLWLTAGCTLIYALPGPINQTTQTLIYTPFFLLLLAQACVRPSSREPEMFDANRTRSPINF